MARFWIVIAIAACFSATCSAFSCRKPRLPELVGPAEYVVVGKITEVGRKEYTVKVTAQLYGKLGSLIGVIKDQDERCQLNNNYIFFLKTAEDGRSLDFVWCAAAVLDCSNQKEVCRLVDMKINPIKYFDDPKQSADEEFLEILGYAFAKVDLIGQLRKADAVKHLQKNLTSENGKVIKQTISTLKKIGSKEAASMAIPLIGHADEAVRLEAIEFLEWAKEKNAVKSLCKALDDSKRGDRLGPVIARALGNLRDPAAAPALERAVKRGIEGWAGWALGALGTVDSFEILLEMVDKHGSQDAVSGLWVLIHRSNKKHADWMNVNRFHQNMHKWREWWGNNQADFEIIKTADEAFGPKK